MESNYEQARIRHDTIMSMTQAGRFEDAMQTIHDWESCLSKASINTTQAAHEWMKLCERSRRFLRRAQLDLAHRKSNESIADTLKDLDSTLNLVTKAASALDSKRQELSIKSLLK